MAEQLDPRFAALAETERIEMIIGHVSARLASENATLERLVGEGARAIAFGLVYVGDQVGRLVEDRESRPPQTAKAVKVVSLTARTVLLEVDGEQRQLFAGEVLSVPGLSSAHYKAALEKIANLEDRMGPDPADDEMREIAIGALAAGER